MANIKGKIIISSALVIFVGIGSYIVFNHFKKKKIIKKIYDKLNDTSSEQGQQALYDEESQILGSNAFDPNFWQKTTGSPKPNANLLLPTKIARDRARDINTAIGFVSEDEDEIISAIKKLKSKGQISQVASAYANSPLNFGNLANDMKNALTGYFDGDKIKQLNTYINSLPN